MDAAKELGVEVVQAWRNSLKARPPPMKADDEHYPGKDRRYEDLAEEQIPLTESLMDCMERGEELVWKKTSSSCDYCGVYELRRRNNYSQCIF